MDKLKIGQNLTFKLNLTLKVKTHQPQNNRDLNQGVLKLVIKLELMASYLADKLVIDTRTHGHTDRLRQRQCPKAQISLVLKRFGLLKKSCWQIHCLVQCVVPNINAKCFSHLYIQRVWRSLHFLTMPILWWILRYSFRPHALRLRPISCRNK